MFCGGFWGGRINKGGIIIKPLSEVLYETIDYLHSDTFNKRYKNYHKDAREEVVVYLKELGVL